MCPHWALRLSASSQEKLRPPGAAERALGGGGRGGRGWLSLWSLELPVAAPKVLLGLGLEQSTGSPIEPPDSQGLPVAPWHLASRGRTTGPSTYCQHEGHGLRGCLGDTQQGWPGAPATAGRPAQSQLCSREGSPRCVARARGVGADGCWGIPPSVVSWAWGRAGAWESSPEQLPAGCRAPSPLGCSGALLLVRTAGPHAAGLFQAPLGRAGLAARA